MAIYYKDFNGEVKTVISGKTNIPLADKDTIGGIKVKGTSTETSPYTALSQGAVNQLLEGYSKKDHTHLIKDIYQLDQALQAAGKVKSVNGQTGDVVVKEYDDSSLKNRVTALERKPDKDTIYDDTVLKNRVSAVESVTSSLSSIYLRQDTASTVYATKEDLKKVGATSYVYQLAAFDTTASAEKLEALKHYEKVEDALKDDLAIQAIANSYQCVIEIIESENILKMIIDSKKLASVFFSGSATSVLVTSDKVLNLMMNSKNKINLSYQSSPYSYKVPYWSDAKAHSKGKFLPLKSSQDCLAGKDINKMTVVSEKLGEWLKNNKYDPIAFYVRHTSGYRDIDVFDLTGF